MTVGDGDGEQVWVDPTDMVDVGHEDVIDEQIQQQVERVNIELQKLLAYAYWKGNDGVDVVMDGDDVLTDPSDYSVGFKWEAWQGEPPHRDLFRTGIITRYDFRDLTRRQERQLLAVIGVQPEDIDRDR